MMQPNTTIQSTLQQSTTRSGPAGNTQDSTQALKPQSGQQTKTWVLASNNAGKLAEFRRLFSEADLSVNIVAQRELNIDDAIEDGKSFVENAIIKARHASRASGLPALADDSGLCVPVLGNAPGIYSARYGGEHGNDAKNNAKLITDLAPIRAQSPDTAIKAQFVCVLAFVRHPDDPLPIIAQGLWHGEILAAPIGTGGFGYDPLFWLPELQTSAACLDPAHKNKISHRGQAIAQLLAQVQVQVQVQVTM